MGSSSNWKDAAFAMRKFEFKSRWVHQNSGLSSNGRTPLLQSGNGSSTLLGSTNLGFLGSSFVGSAYFRSSMIACLTLKEIDESGRVFGINKRGDEFDGRGSQKIMLSSG